MQETIFDLLTPKLISLSLSQDAVATNIWRKSIDAYWRYRGNYPKMAFSTYGSWRDLDFDLWTKTEQFIPKYTTDKSLVKTNQWYHRYRGNNMLDRCMHKWMTKDIMPLAPSNSGRGINNKGGALIHLSVFKNCQMVGSRRSKLCLGTMFSKKYQKSVLQQISPNHWNKVCHSWESVRHTM